MPEVHNGAAINEALEIAKHYEDDKVVSFINGILGSFVRAECAEPEVRNVEVQPETEAQK